MYKFVLYPKVGVNRKRHEKLYKEAKKEGVSMEAVAEAKFALADKMLKELKKNAK